MSTTIESGPLKYAQLAPLPPEGEIHLYDFFPKVGDIEIEIGTGRGMFLIERARIASNAYILGIEIKKKWAYKVSQRCAREGIDRVRIVSGDARAILPRISPAMSVRRIYFHFPDPWWKKRHAKRRLFGSDLIKDCLRLLKPGGELFVQTDVEERAREYAACIANFSELFLDADKGLRFENPYGARSNRERRAEEDGIPIFRILAVKSMRASGGDL
ncbi:MAG: tRNA (guanosine(46)-N7)-methyltransferase TrmB [Deltaproteobacteria bacterium]|nr:tRNA (guanosine(46)-N7)-methyltransferase TrmB [Deltaproteobacteria bacterium]